MPSAQPVRAVIFDLGGVVLDSPFGVLAEFERSHGLEPGALARAADYAASGEGPWQRLERGELEMRAFCEEFDGVLAGAGLAVSCAPLMASIAERLRVRDEMLRAVRELRARYSVAALTNIWDSDDALARTLAALRPEFDVFVESWRLGLRKPEPAIYEETCRRLGVAPGEAVFLDDIGTNLGPARALGMRTIKVETPAQALADLARALGINAGA